MKMFKIIACLAIIVAALAYAGLPPIVVNGVAFTAPKFPVYTYPTNGPAAIYEINGWIVVKGFTVKDTVSLASKLADGTPSLKPTNQCIAIQAAKAFKGSRKDLVPGGFAQVVYGVFTNADGSDAVGDLAQLTVNDPTTQLDIAGKPGKSFALSLKGITVGTVIAKKCAPTAADISHALLTEIKLAKGVALTAGGKAPYGVLGGVLGSPGTLGVAPGIAAYPSLVAQFTPNLRETSLNKATAKGAIYNFMIFSESIPAVNGKAKASLSTKLMANVRALDPGVGTNSAYKSKVPNEPHYTLSKP